MSLSRADAAEQPEGQATFEMANLPPKTTNLPFVVWVSQRDNYPHDARVKVARSAKVIASEMGSYAIRPFRFAGGRRLDTVDEARLQAWVDKNIGALLAFWNAEIEYTEDLLERIVPL